MPKTTCTLGTLPGFLVTGLMSRIALLLTLLLPGMTVQVPRVTYLAAIATAGSLQDTLTVNENGTGLEIVAVTGTMIANAIGGKTTAATAMTDATTVLARLMTVGRHLPLLNAVILATLPTVLVCEAQSRTGTVSRRV